MQAWPGRMRWDVLLSPCLTCLVRCRTNTRANTPQYDAEDVRNTVRGFALFCAALRRGPVVRMQLAATQPRHTRQNDRQIAITRQVTRGVGRQAWVRTATPRTLSRTLWTGVSHALHMRLTCSTLFTLLLPRARVPPPLTIPRAQAYVAPPADCISTCLSRPTYHGRIHDSGHCDAYQASAHQLCRGHLRRHRLLPLWLCARWPARTDPRTRASSAA